MSQQSPLETAAQNTVNHCRKRGLKLALAESCTGGLIASALTDAPGISDVFLGSAVTYCNQSKHQVIGVTSESLEKFGAVSEQVAREMAQGAREKFGADMAASVTGIAGPTGAMPGKPVGTVHIAAANAQGQCLHRKFVFGGGRDDVRRQSAIAALELLLQLAVDGQDE